MKYLYDRRGDAVAYVEGQYVFSMDGAPTGYVEGAHVYRISGEYVGELFRDMVVDQYLSNPGGIGRVIDPGRAFPAENPGSRGAFDYGFPDVIHKLFE
jgi:4-fold beta-flower domain-containing protein